MKQECIIFLTDSLQSLNETYLSYIQLFAKHNQVFIIPSKTVVSLKQLIVSGLYKHYFRAMTKLHPTMHMFLPIGILPIQRIPVINTINNALLFALLSFQLHQFFKKTGVQKKPIVYVCGSEEAFGPHWIYIPGIFKEKVCIYDVSQVSSKPHMIQKMQTMYEQKLCSYADAIFIQKDIDSIMQNYHAHRVISAPKDPIEKIKLVYKVVKKFPGK